MPPRRANPYGDDRPRPGQTAQYHPGGAALAESGRQPGPLAGDPSVTQPSQRPEQARPTPPPSPFGGGPGEPTPMDRQQLAPIPQGLLDPNQFLPDTGVQTQPPQAWERDVAGQTRAENPPGGYLPGPLPPDRPSPEPPPPPGDGVRIDWMPGDPGYNPDEGRGMWPPGPRPPQTPSPRPPGPAIPLPGGPIAGTRDQDRNEMQQREGREQRTRARRARPVPTGQVRGR